MTAVLNGTGACGLGASASTAPFGKHRVREEGFPKAHARMEAAGSRCRSTSPPARGGRQIAATTIEHGRERLLAGSPTKSGT